MTIIKLSRDPGATSGPPGQGPGSQRSGSPPPRVIDLAENSRHEGGGARPVRVLLVEDDPLFASLVRSALHESRIDFEIDTASTLSDALARLVREPVDLLLADLNLPDSKGTSTIRFLKRAAPGAPLIVLSGTDDLAVALEAVREGAEEYVAKDSFSVHSLVWLILLVLERHRRVVEDLGHGYVDPASGLASLPALEVLGRYLLRVVDRTGLHLGLLFVRMEVASRGKWSDWEALLSEVSGALQRTLRRCDIVSRVGRFELAGVLVSDNPQLASVLPRVEEAIILAGVASQVEIGLAVHHPGETETLTQLVQRARAEAHGVPA